MLCFQEQMPFGFSINKAADLPAFVSISKYEIKIVIGTGGSIDTAIDTKVPIAERCSNFTPPVINAYDARKSALFLFSLLNNVFDIPVFFFIHLQMENRLVNIYRVNSLDGIGLHEAPQQIKTNCYRRSRRHQFAIFVKNSNIVCCQPERVRHMQRPNINFSVNVFSRRCLHQRYHLL